MSNFFSNFSIATVMTVGLAVNAVAEDVMPPQGECMQHLYDCSNFRNGDVGATLIEGNVDGLPEIEGILLAPEDGAVKKTLISIEILVPTPSYYIKPTLMEDKISSVTLVSEDVETICATSYGVVNNLYVDGERYTSITIEFPEVAENGQYTLNIPAGTIIIYDFSEAGANGIPIGINPELTAIYTVDSSMPGLFETYFLNPQPGSGLVTLSGINIMFPEIASEANINANYGTVIVTKDDVTYSGYIRRDDSYNDCMVQNIYFVNDWYEPVIFESGRWTMRIEEGTFSYLGENNSEIVADYIVYSQSEEPLVLENTFPANEAEIKKLNVVNLIYQVAEGAAIDVNKDIIGYIDVTVDEDFVYGNFVVGKPTKISNELVNIPLAIEDVYDEFYDGEYQITLPKGLFYETKYNEETGEFTAFEGYKASDEVTLNFRVNSELEGILDCYTLIPADAEIVTSLEEVTLSFDKVPDYLSVSRNYWSYDDIMLSDGEVVYTGWLNMLESPFKIAFFDAKDEEAVVANGVWKLTIPAGYFIFDGEESPEIVANYTVDSTVGINDITTDHTVTVVTVDGRIVLQNISAGHLNELDPGMYIVNGKKFLIKK